MGRLLATGAGALALTVVGVGVYYAFSCLILTLVGRLFPLSGGRRRRD